MKQLKRKDIDQEKALLYEKQKGFCLICERELDSELSKNHLDHDHALSGRNSGRVRGLLCIYCNPLIGTLEHEFKRSGLVSKAIDFEMWLGNMVKYLKQDYYDNNYHPNFIPDKAKEFGRKNKPEMIDIMNEYGFLYDEKDTREKLIKKFKDQFKKYQHSLSNVKE